MVILYILLYMLFISIFSKANDVADEGVLVHARDNSDLFWVNHLFTCGGDYMIHAGYDYYVLGLYGETDKRTGAWCDTEATYGDAYFPCESNQYQFINYTQ